MDKKLLDKMLRNENSQLFLSLLISLLCVKYYQSKHKNVILYTKTALIMHTVSLVV